jgi:hypothetical protein
MFDSFVKGHFFYYILESDILGACALFYFECISFPFTLLVTSHVEFASTTDVST